MPRSSTSNSDWAGPIPAAEASLNSAAFERSPTTRRRIGGLKAVLGWAVVATIVMLLLAEGMARALAPLPPNRVWPDKETQFKADHAAQIEASGATEPLVFAGSSVSDAAFDPREVADVAGMDVPTFNYSLEGSLTSTTVQFLEAAVVDQVGPETVVLGIVAADIGAAPTNAARLGDVMGKARGYRLANGTPTVADRIDAFWSERSALVAHREVLRDPYKLYLSRGDEWVPPFNDPETGALIRHLHEDFKPASELAEEHDQLAPVEPELEAIVNLRSYLGQRGIRLVLVELPVLESDSDPEAVAFTHRALGGVSKEACIDIIDLSGTLQDRDYWSDAAHANGAGTAAISRAVGEWLRRNPVPAAC